MPKLLIVSMLRQAAIGLVLVLLSLPLLWMFSRVVGLGTPPLSGVLLLGASAVAAWAAGGFLGATLGSGARGLKVSGTPVVAALSGLVLGGVVCFTVAPFYAQSVVEGVASDAATDVFHKRDEILARARSAATKAAQESARNPARAQKAVRDAENLKRQAAHLSAQAREAAGSTATAAFSSAKQLALRAAARLPAMTLLIWTLLGPAIAGFLEARRAAACSSLNDEAQQSLRANAQDKTFDDLIGWSLNQGGGSFKER
jgi:hypothetical protein